MTWGNDRVVSQLHGLHHGPFRSKLEFLELLRHIPRHRVGGYYDLLDDMSGYSQLQSLTYAAEDREFPPGPFLRALTPLWRIHSPSRNSHAPNTMKAAHIVSVTPVDTFDPTTPAMNRAAPSAEIKVNNRTILSTSVVTGCNSMPKQTDYVPISTPI